MRVEFESNKNKYSYCVVLIFRVSSPRDGSEQETGPTTLQLFAFTNCLRVKNLDGLKIIQDELLRQETVPKSVVFSFLCGIWQGTEIL